eukprot:7673600-Pyramimonas_sp.AAC.1
MRDVGRTEALKQIPAAPRAFAALAAAPRLPPQWHPPRRMGPAPPSLQAGGHRESEGAGWSRSVP